MTVQGWILPLSSDQFHLDESSKTSLRHPESILMLSCVTHTVTTHRGGTDGLMIGIEPTPETSPVTQKKNLETSLLEILLLSQFNTYMAISLNLRHLK
jgi:hypothetical protein